MSSSPWGRVQSVRQIAPGIRAVTTASHGGILLSPGRNQEIPEYMRTTNGAYEEDCEWCIPTIILFGDFATYQIKTGYWTVSLKPHVFGEAYDFHAPHRVQTPAELWEDAMRTFINWFPESYEQWSGRKLQIGESDIADHGRSWVDSKTRKYDVGLLAEAQDRAGQ